MIKRALPSDADAIATLADRLWPGHGVHEFQKEMQELLADDHAAVFLAFSGNEPVGFAQVQLRHDYVEGTSTGPVGYLEGLYVEARFRQEGMARELVRGCEEWARQQGCTEFASDCELGNDVSRDVHLHLGFNEVNRIIAFAKKL
ncbi:aminoglycoside 6'-N-acetyltransferase [Edaphobacillus lindanitolerans]|uniref:Aminoglycoside N(6')-acetyltransferase type 1 n=1 Tax=Edaphobacillus lindanitolerans TaxID=550447 RepID=A0A1U7PRH9_9BACI|nr:aminoglycoside 6'-N-acetyltransferase [Edaphobacillus lindanitolerans]SIT87344.1 aminoglycoside 6'-N-acetyltransferase I [Edaphobacillus lindanitolerans]